MRELVTLLLCVWTCQVSQSKRNDSWKDAPLCPFNKTDKTTMALSNQETYLVTAGSAPTATDCVLTFTSTDIQGIVCISQEESAKINVPGVSIVAGKSPVTTTFNQVFKIENDNKFTRHEMCLTENSVQFQLLVPGSNQNIDMRDVKFSFKVYTIDNPDREVWFDDAYCGGHYILMDSKITVYDAFPAAFTNDRRVTRPCSLTFFVLNPSKKLICFVYMPPSKLTCGYNSNFVISIMKEIVSSKGVRSKDEVFKLHCSDAKSGNKQLYCGGSSASYTLTINSDSNPKSDRESEDRFHIQVMDYSGTEEQLKTEFKIRDENDVKERNNQDTTATTVAKKERHPVVRDDDELYNASYPKDNKNNVPGTDDDGANGVLDVDSILFFVLLSTVILLMIAFAVCFIKKAWCLKWKCGLLQHQDVGLAQPGFTPVPIRNQAQQAQPSEQI